MDVVEVKRLPIDERLRDFILERDNYICRYCGTKKPPFHLDHVYPVVKGGETSPENLVTSCVRCNARKHTSIIFPKPIGYFEENRSKNVSITNVLVLSVGIGAVANGFMNISEYVVYAKISILIGIAVLYFVLGRLTTGRV